MYSASGIWRLDHFWSEDLLVSLNEIGRIVVYYERDPIAFAFCEMKKINYSEEEVSMRSRPFLGTSRLPISGNRGLFVPVSMKGCYIVGLSSFLRKEWITWYGAMFQSDSVEYFGSVADFIQLTAYVGGYPNQGWMDNHVSSLRIDFGGQNETVADKKGSYRVVE